MDQQQPAAFPEPVQPAPANPVLPEGIIHAGAAAGPQGEPVVGLAAAFNAAAIQHELRNLRVELNQRGAGCRPPSFVSGKPDDWLAFNTNFRRVYQANRWDEERTKNELLVAMKGIAANMTDDLELDENETFEQFRRRVENRFLPPADSLASRVDFSAAKQHRGESSQVWHSRLRALHIRAWGPHPNRNLAHELTHHFVKGIYSDYVRLKVSEAAPQTYEAALEAASAAEASAMLAGVNINPFRRVNQLEYEEDESDCADVSAIQQHCWECGDPEHRREACPEMKKKSAPSKGKDNKENEAPKSRNKNGAGRPGKPPGTKGVGPGAQRKVNQLGEPCSHHQEN